MLYSTFSRLRAAKVFLVMVFVFCPVTSVLAQLPGLDAPAPVGPFLNGNLPTRAPATPGLEEWDVVDAFPNLNLPNTLVIIPNPADDRLYVGSRGGAIVSFANQAQASTTEPFMDLSDRVAVVWDGGFLGMVFHPQFGTPGSPYERTFYAYYSSYCPTDASASDIDFGACNPGYPTGSTIGFFNTWLRLSRFEAVWDASAQVWRGDAASEEPMLNIRLYNDSHRGGGMLFADDGMLYLTIGEQFRYDTAQDIVDTLEGGVLRLAVDIADNGDGTWTCPAGSHLPLRRYQDFSLNPDEMSGRLYCIPDDNPWLEPDGTQFEEYFSIGHRNPHRLAFDPVTGFLWSGEIGESSREEINVILPGRNYGWPFREGTLEGPGDAPVPLLGILTEPVIDFTRAEANAIIGGYVYRGAMFPELQGRFITGDYVTANIWALTLDTATMTAEKELLTTFDPGALGTFGQDNNGEIFLGSVAANVPLQRLERIDNRPEPPALLSQTGAFADVLNLVVDPAGVPYDLVPFWSDGAVKSRWIFLPNDGSHDQADEQIIFFEEDNWIFPIGTVLMKHFELELEEGNPASAIRLETRFMVLSEDDDWYGVTYRWRPDQSDADLLTAAETADYTIQTTGGGTRQQTWLYPGRDDCLTCHTPGAGGALGTRTHQLNRDYTYAATGRSANQLHTWSALGMFTPALDAADIPTFPAGARLDDITASLEHRARSWLDSNCAYCHRPETGNRAAFDARLTTDLASQGLIWGGVSDDLGIPGAYLIHPGEAHSSIVYQRAAQVGAEAMPPLAKALVQDPAMTILSEWIARLDPGFPLAGVFYEYYEPTGLFALPDFDTLTPVRTGTIATFDISPRDQDDNFAFRFSGVIEVPADGLWTFYTSSDDGSQLFIDGALVVDNDGLHGAQEVAGALTLSAGLHDIVVTMFERDGGEVLNVNWEGPGVAKQAISSSNLYPTVPSTAVNTPPILANPGPRSSEEGEVVSVALAAVDADGDALYFGASGLPEGLSLDPLTGVVSGTIPGATIGTYAVTVSASDANEVAVVNFDWSVVAAGAGNAPPTVSNPGDQASLEGEVVALNIVASDAEGDTLNYQAQGLPPGLAIDAASGLISGTLAGGSAGAYAVIVTVSDGANGTQIAFTWSITVDAPQNAPPVVINPGDQTSVEGELISLGIVASDADGDPLSYAASGLPAGLGIDAVSGVIGGTLVPGSAGVTLVTVTVSDAVDATPVQFTWTVSAPLNTPPVVTNPGDQASTEGELISLGIVASDADGDTLSYSASGLPAGLAIDAASGVIGGTLAPGSAGVTLVTVTVSDGADAVPAQFNWSVTGAGNTAPTVTNPGDQSNNEGDPVSLPIVASDADGDTLTYSASGLPSGLGIDAASGVISGTLAPGSAGSGPVTVTVSDGTGSTPVQFTWQVTAPSLWTSTDIGGVAVAGAFSEAGGVITLSASGVDIWNESDSFRFAYRALAGDGEIIARVASLTNTHPWTKAGVMIRDSLAPDSAHAMTVVTPLNGTAVQRRLTAGASSLHTPGPEVAAPYWVRLVRQGSLFSGYVSPDGVAWTLVDSVTIAMTGSVHIGLAITSHAYEELATAVFDNITVNTGEPDAVPPAAPAGHSATPVSDNRIDLSWTAPGDIDVAGYNIYRDGGPTPIATAATTSFSDTGLIANTLYTYQVSAFDAASNESLLSDPASATTLLQPAWQSDDIGAVLASGSFSQSGGTLTLNGSGVDIWDASDSFRYAYQTLTGDGEIVARLASLSSDIHGWTKAGVMMRESLTPDSAHAMMALTPSNGAAFQRRLTTAESSLHTGGPLVAAPYWVRLVRQGDVFSGYVSADGQAWVLVDSATIAMPAAVSVGLAVTSHNNEELATAVFDSVTIIDP